MFTEVFALSAEINDVELDLVPFFVMFFVSSIFIVFPVLYKRWYFYRRRLKKSTITAEYLPPLKFTPAEVSYLFSRKLTDRDIAATIIHLAQRGLLHAKSVNGVKKVFVGPKVETNLKDHEKMLIDQADVSGGISGSELLSRAVVFSNKNANGSGIEKSKAMNKLVHKNLLNRGYVRKVTIRKFSVRILKLLTVLIAVLVWLPLISSLMLKIVDEGSSEFGDFGGFMIVGLLLTLIMAAPLIIISIALVVHRGSIVGREWIITPRMGRLWPQIVGFRQYVRLAEKGKLNFRTDELKKTSKNDVLPYAVALGFIKNWRDIVS